MALPTTGARSVPVHQRSSYERIADGRTAICTSDVSERSGQPCLQAAHTWCSARGVTIDGAMARSANHAGGHLSRRPWQMGLPHCASEPSQAGECNIRVCEQHRAPPIEVARRVAEATDLGPAPGHRWGRYTADPEIADGRRRGEVRSGSRDHRHVLLAKARDEHLALRAYGGCVARQKPRDVAPRVAPGVRGLEARLPGALAQRLRAVRGSRRRYGADRPPGARDMIASRARRHDAFANDFWRCAYSRGVSSCTRLRGVKRSDARTAARTTASARPRRSPRARAT